MTIVIVCLIIVVLAIFLFKALSFYRGGTSYLPLSSKIKRIYIAYSIQGDTPTEAIDNSKEFNLTDEGSFEPILKLLEDKEFPRFPLLNDDKLDFNEGWFVNIFPKTGQPFYIYVDKYNVSEYEMKDSRLYEYLRKNYA